jgi:sialic acid synthase SpsE
LLKPYVDFFKIASSDNNYFDLIKSVLETKKKIIISLGLLNLKEIKSLEKYVSKISKKRNITFLHCVTDYPVKPEEANLRSILHLKKKLKIAIGYSDHTLGITAPILATSYGANILEKHFTLDNNQSKFRDHKISLNPINMKKMVDEIRKVKKILGYLKKSVSKGERKNLILARRSIYSKKDLPKNHIIQKKDLILLRPLKGLPVEKMEKILGKKLKKKIKKDTPLKINHFK